ncbi:Uncharacterised protein [uncultured archaeon]|nr:Uncharacterised protein [uncultured archaeon]
MAKKNYYKPKKESPELTDAVNIPYILVLAAVVIANFTNSEVLTLVTFLALLLIYAIKKYDSRIPVAFALLLLVLSAIELAYRSEELANQIAVYAYYYLVVGVLLQLIEYIRNPGDE